MFRAILTLPWRVSPAQLQNAVTSRTNIGKSMTVTREKQQSIIRAAYDLWMRHERFLFETRADLLNGLEERQRAEGIPENPPQTMPTKSV